MPKTPSGLPADNPKMRFKLIVLSVLLGMAAISQGCVYSRHGFDSSPDNTKNASPSSSPGTVGAGQSEGIGGSTAPAGDTGSSGNIGTSGTTGSSGSSAATGASGPTGASGASGATGVSGSTGSAGPSGSAASTGATGASGASGASASTGASGTTGTSGSSGTTTPPAAAAAATPAVCYEFGYVSNKDGADNVYMASNCHSYGEMKISSNTDATIHYHDVTFQKDVTMITADAERTASGVTTSLGAQIWDIRRFGSYSLVPLRYDINHDGNPDFQDAFSVSWVEGTFPTFAAWTPGHGKQVVRLQFSADSTSLSSYPELVNNASGGMSFDRVLWFPRGYPSAGHDMIVVSAKKTPASPFRLYSVDMYQKPNDDLRDILATDEPGHNQVAPAFSPDGNKVAFVKNDSAGNSAIWASHLTVTDSPNRMDPAQPVRITGDAPHLVTQGDSPCWTHDGQKILFEKDGHLWMTDESGGNPTSLDVAVQPESLGCSPLPPMSWAATTIEYRVMTEQPKATIYQRPAEVMTYHTLSGSTGTTGTTGGTGH